MKSKHSDKNSLLCGEFKKMWLFETNNAPQKWRTFVKIKLRGGMPIDEEKARNKQN